LVTIVPRFVATVVLANRDGADELALTLMKYAYVDITSVGGTPTEYLVHVVQMLDPEGGIQCWIEYTYTTTRRRSTQGRSGRNR